MQEWSLWWWPGQPSGQLHPPAWWEVIMDKLSVHICLSILCAMKTYWHGNSFQMHGHFVRGIDRWPVDPFQWFETLMFLLMAWTICWINSSVVGEKRRINALDVVAYTIENITKPSNRQNIWWRLSYSCLHNSIIFNFRHTPWIIKIVHSYFPHVYDMAGKGFIHIYSLNGPAMWRLMLSLS